MCLRFECDNDAIQKSVWLTGDIILLMQVAPPSAIIGSWKVGVTEIFSHNELKPLRGLALNLLLHNGVHKHKVRICVW